MLLVIGATWRNRNVGVNIPLIHVGLSSGPREGTPPLCGDDVRGASRLAASDGLDSRRSLKLAAGWPLARATNRLGDQMTQARHAREKARVLRDFPDGRPYEDAASREEAPDIERRCCEAGRQSAPGSRRRPHRIWRGTLELLYAGAPVTSPLPLLCLFGRSGSERMGRRVDAAASCARRCTETPPYWCRRGTRNDWRAGERARGKGGCCVAKSVSVASSKDRKRRPLAARDKVSRYLSSRCRAGEMAADREARDERR